MRLAAALVHIFTAMGVVCALAATLSVAASQWEGTFLWLGLAFFIDGVDGMFARLVNVKDQLPRFSGERLDLVVDYVTYVFVPVLALLAAGFLPGWTGLVLASFILLSSLFHFTDEDSKAEDLSFVGFPAIWNIVAFYIFAFQLSPLLAGLLVLVCVVFTFVPWTWVHPIRVVALRSLTIAATAAWSLAAFAICWTGFQESGWLPKGILLAVALYGVGLTVFGRGHSAPEPD